MTHFTKFLTVALLSVFVLATGLSQAAQEKVPLDKLPKAVTDAIMAKFPMAELKRATKETDDGKTFYEVIFNNEKKHMHGLVTPEGKFYEIHRHVEAKDVPEKVTKAVHAKYPADKCPWEGIHERADIDGKVLGYEITLEATKGNSIEVNVDINGMILRETKLDSKKDGK